MNLFDRLDASKRDRDSALAKIETNADDYFSLAMKIIEGLAFDKTFPIEFSGEDIAKELIIRLGRPHHKNVYGALVMQAIRTKLIEPTGLWTSAKNKQAHARMIRLYRFI